MCVCAVLSSTAANDMPGLCHFTTNLSLAAYVHAYSQDLQRKQEHERLEASVDVKAAMTELSAQVGCASQYKLREHKMQACFLLGSPSCLCNLEWACCGWYAFPALFKTQRFVRAISLDICLQHAWWAASFLLTSVRAGSQRLQHKRARLC